MFLLSRERNYFFFINDCNTFEVEDSNKLKLIIISAFESPLLDIGLAQVPPQISVYRLSVPLSFVLIQIISPAGFLSFSVSCVSSGCPKCCS